MVTLSCVEMKCFGLGQVDHFFLDFFLGGRTHSRGLWEETFALWLQRWSGWRKAKKRVVMEAGLGGGGEVFTFCPAGAQWCWWHPARLGLTEAFPLWEQVPHTGSAGTARSSLWPLWGCVLSSLSALQWFTAEQWCKGEAAEPCSSSSQSQQEVYIYAKLGESWNCAKPPE